MPKPFEDRFWSKVEKSASCWEWVGATAHGGYGKFGIAGKSRSAHRISYELAYGPIPDGLHIDHVCHNRVCIRPDHLRLVTNKQNMENRRVFSSPSGVRGVSWDKAREKWEARVKHNGKTIRVGRFYDIEDAEAAIVELRNELFTHNDADRNAA